MLILITAATKEEWLPCSMQFKKQYADNARLKIEFHTTGVGLLASAVTLTRLLLQLKPNLVIQMGIAGSFDTELALGNVVLVKEEVLGDMGVDESGKWKDLFELKLLKKNQFPFTNKKLKNPWLKKWNLLKLPMVKSITVNQISTHQNRIGVLQKKYKPLIEGMEGAALHYTGLEMNIPFLQIRSVSNYIGERDKNYWKIEAAIYHLNQTVFAYINALYKISTTP